jgi:hypothetical protein
LIYGASVSSDKIKEIAGELGIEMTETYDEKEYKKDDYDLAEDIAKKLNLSYESGPESYYYYFGRCPSSIGDNETGLEFKSSIEKSIKEALGEGYECSYHEEAWRDG